MQRRRSSILHVLLQDAGSWNSKGTLLRCAPVAQQLGCSARCSECHRDSLNPVGNSMLPPILEVYLNRVELFVTRSWLLIRRLLYHHALLSRVLHPRVMLCRRFRTPVVEVQATTTSSWHVVSSCQKGHTGCRSYEATVYHMTFR